MNDNMKKIMVPAIPVLLAVCLAVWKFAPGRELELHRYDAQFLGLFDTVTSIVGYAEDKETFTAFAQEFHDELESYHQLYDIYHDYEGINNIKTINDNAGIQPVNVDRRIIDMLEEAVELYKLTNGRVNVAMGSVLKIWHEYREDGIDDPEHAEVPSMDELSEAAKHMDISGLEIDREASTVYLRDPGMRLDVGAIAKGYATEMVCRKLEADGMSDALVSVGGNIRSIGTKPNDEKWTVGVQNPDTESPEKYVLRVELEDMSLVTSGTYQRYYTVNGTRYHHIIHPDLLMPWDRYVSVSILCRDSGRADALATAVFNMEPEDGKALIESMEDTEAMWIEPDGTEHFSSGFKQYVVKE